MDYFLQTVLPKRSSLVSKIRINKPGLRFGSRRPTGFTPRQIRELLDKLTGLKELRFEFEIPLEGEWLTLLGTELEEKGIVIISPS